MRCELLLQIGVAVRSAPSAGAEFKRLAPSAYGWSLPATSRMATATAGPRAAPWLRDVGASFTNGSHHASIAMATPMVFPTGSG